MANHAARGHNGNVDACGQCVLFSIKVAAAAAAVNRHAGGAGEITKTLCGLVDLQGEFSSGGNDQALNVVSSSPLINVVHRRKKKRGRFSCSGLGNANQVFSFRDGRNGQGLNGRGHFKTHGLQALLNGLTERQFSERELFGLLGLFFCFWGFFRCVRGQRFLRLGFCVPFVGLGRVLGGQLFVGAVCIDHQSLFLHSVQMWQRSDIVRPAHHAG